jgi:hypothetical protein
MSALSLDSNWWSPALVIYSFYRLIWEIATSGYARHGPQQSVRMIEELVLDPGPKIPDHLTDAAKKPDLPTDGAKIPDPPTHAVEIPDTPTDAAKIPSKKRRETRVVFGCKVYYKCEAHGRVVVHCTYQFATPLSRRRWIALTQAGVFQYVVIKLGCAVVTVVCEAMGVYNDGIFVASYAYPWIALITNTSQMARICRACALAVVPHSSVFPAACAVFPGADVPSAVK